MEYIATNFLKHKLIVVSYKGKIINILFDSQTNYKLLKLNSIQNDNSKILIDVKIQLEAYFDQKNQEFKFKRNLIGTDFQKLVWLELLKIPYSQTRTYQEIANYIGKPKAYRAVANAVAKNPLIIVIPCHRIIRSDGFTGQYSAGSNLKKELLKLEGSIL